MNPYEVGNRSLANQALGEARSTSGETYSGDVFRGQVMASQGADVYRIGALDENGVIVRIYDFVESAVQLTNDEIVTVKVDARDNAAVLSGGGGTPCNQSLFLWAILP